jgi:ABC-type phosphate/phosphonate transport system ATPase subunit
MVLVGERFYGKTTIVECLKEYVQKKDNKSISLNSIYFEAYTANELLGAN